MIFKTAWKNVWRNRTRSLVVITSITIGIFAGIFAVGLMNGTMEQRVDAALNEEISHIQINRVNFRDNFDIQLKLEDISKIDSEIIDTKGVEAIANRVIINAIANTATKSVGIQLVGVNPAQEQEVLKLDKTIIPGTGSYFNEQSRYNQAFIGEDLAKDLNIIRFRIDEETIDSLRLRKVPAETLVKLEPFIGERFPSQKAFSKSVKKALSVKESAKYAKTILEEAWSFRDRSKLTLTFLDKNNVQTGGMFRIAGIYDIKNSVFEESQVFVLNSDLQRLTGLNEDDYHMIVVRLSDRDAAKEVTDILHRKFPNLEIQNWKEISPDLAMMTAMIEKFNAVFMLIILAALSFGIVNTMLMVVLERTKELGMLTAIGMNKKKVFTMIMAESVFLSLVGGIVGMLLSKILLLLTSSRGINFSGTEEGFEAMGFSAHIYPAISNSFFITVTLLVIITGILSSIYPALKALKLDPSEALRTE